MHFYQLPFVKDEVKVKMHFLRWLAVSTNVSCEDATYSASFMLTLGTKDLPINVVKDKRTITCWVSFELQGSLVVKL